MLGAAGAERSGTGKDDSGDSGFQQSWEAAAGPLLPAFCECGPARHAPASIPSPRCAAALASTSGFGTVHDPPPLLRSSSLGPASSVLSDTFPWVLRQTRYTVCLIGILDDKNPCLYAFFKKNLIDERSFVIVGSLGSCKFSQGGEKFFPGITCFIADWDLSGLVYPLPSKITESLFQNWG